MPQGDSVFCGTSKKATDSLRLRTSPSSNSSCPLCPHPRSPSLGFSWSLLKWMWRGNDLDFSEAHGPHWDGAAPCDPCSTHHDFGLPFVCERFYSKNKFKQSSENIGNKEASQRRANNGVFMKQRQGPLFPPQGAIDTVWGCELSYRHWKLHLVDRLTSGWPECNRDISCRNSENWHQGDGIIATLELSINCAWNSHDAGQTTDQVQSDCLSWLCCFCKEPVASVYRALTSWMSVVGWGIQPLYRSPPSAQLLASEWKKTFLSMKLASYLAFEGWAAGTHFW